MTKDSSGSSKRMGNPIGDGSGPENRRAREGLGGSTPSPSASICAHPVIVDGVVQLYDVYLDDKWIGSFRTLRNMAGSLGTSAGNGFWR